MRPLNTRTTLLALGVVVLMASTSIMATLATNATWGVSVGNTWTWRITKCAWDQEDTTTTWIGRTATINVTAVDNSSTHSWITGDVWLKEANGTAGPQFQDVLLGNVALNGSELVVYADTGEFILPVIVPLPVNQSLAAFAAFLDLNLRDLIAQVPAGFPIAVNEEFTHSINGLVLTVSFTVNVSYQGYALDDQPFEVAIEFDASGVAKRLEAYVKDISIQVGSGTITASKFTLFEILRTDATGGLDIPGFPAIALAVIVPAATAILAWRAKRRHD